MVHCEDIEFSSNGATLRGWLFRTASQERGPGIVMAHGFTAVREMFLDRYASAFASAGFTTLVYDHFGFGASEGAPRQSPTPSIQLEGYRDAISWLARHGEVDPGRIGIWGSSRSGGLVIALAAEVLPIRCAFAQAPAFGRPAIQLSAVTITAITEAMSQGRLDDMIPAVTETPDGIGIMFADNAYKWFTRVCRERAPLWRNGVRIGSLSEPFLPIDSLPKVKVPLRLLVAPDDQLTPPQAGIEVAAANPIIDVVSIAGGHFDPYEAGFEISSQSAIDWFSQHMI
jgi:uncharacterized protein